MSPKGIFIIQNPNRFIMDAGERLALPMFRNFYASKNVLYREQEEDGSAFE
jgi:hypothetical protein